MEIWGDGLLSSENGRRHKHTVDKISEDTPQKPVSHWLHLVAVINDGNNVY